MDIAIIGMAIRFPGASTLREFSENLAKGVDSVQEISMKRRKATGLLPSDNYQLLGYLEDIDLFDPAFFGISRAEAKTMSPHQRILMEVAYEMFEHAGYNFEFFNNSNTSVYIGDTQIQYYELAREIEPTLYTGNMNSIIASRIARFFNLRGKALNIDTTCSSSLVALHLACQDLAANESDYALVGGVSLNLFPNKKTTTDHLGILSPGGKARTFSAQADGTSAGEGAVCILLKPLEKALADHDIVHAVIKGSAINQDADLSGSLTAPSSIAQAEVITQAWKKSGVNPLHIGYIEAHGTGTKLGDPIEIEGVTRAFQQYTDKKSFCAISSVKSNIGHTDCVAGLAGLVKAVLSLTQQQLFPSLHFNEPNPFIDFANAPVFVNNQLLPWRRNGTPRIAGISSFGLTGTNCHTIIAEAPARDNQPANDANCLIVLSAQHAASLKANMKALLNYVQTEQNASIQDISYTLATGRKQYSYRYATVVSSAGQLQTALQSAVDNTVVPVTATKAVFILSDWQVSYPGLTDEFNRLPVFKHYFDDCVAHAKGRAHTVAFSQFAFQFSFYRLLEHIGITIEAVTGDELGRLVIAALTGQLSMEQAMNTVFGFVPSAKTDFDERCKNLAVKFKHEAVTFIELGPLTGITAKLESWKTADSHYNTIALEESAASFQAFLQKLYLGNIDIQFEKAIAGGKKIELPAYQFNRERFWLEEEYSFTKVKDWCYELQWVKDELITRREQSTSKNILLVTTGNSALALELQQRLTAQHNNCYTVYLASETGYETVAAELQQKGIVLQELIFLTSPGLPADNLPGQLQQELASGIYAHFTVCKTFNALLSAKGARLVLVTINACNVLPGEHPSPLQAMHTGLVKGLQAENPLLAIRSIDIDAQEIQPAEVIIEELEKEYTLSYCAYRNRVRYVPKLCRLTAMAEHDLTEILPENGVYLVTGGIGGIGLELCKSILRRQPATFIIIGRTALPFKTQWKKLLAANEPSPVTQKINALMELEKKGAQVEYHATDVSDAWQMDVLFATIKNRFAKIDGVIHAAGLAIENKPFEQLDIQQFENALAAKVTGTVLLDDLVQELDPAFVVLFSSLNALVPKKNSTAYTVANTFEDAYAAYRYAASKRKYISINWSGWDVKNVKDGLSAFYHVLQLNRSNIAVGDMDLSGFANNPFFLTEATVVQRAPAPVKETVKLTKTEAALLTIWKEVLKSDSITTEDDFFEVGGHSLIGIQVVNRIEKELGVAIDFEVFFDYFTVKTLSAHIDELLSAGAGSEFEVIEPVEEQEYYEVSYAQKRLWILDQLIEDSVYNIPTTYVLNGQLNRGALEQAYATLTKRHESLRTILISVDGIPKQKILDPHSPAFAIRYTDLRSTADRYEMAGKRIEAITRTRFELDKGPIVLAELIQVENNKHLFSFTLHHIISDGWSSGIITRELISFYNDYNRRGQIAAMPLSIQYKDYTNWQRKLLQSDQFNEHRSYWLQQFTGDIPVLDLPTELPRPLVQSFRGKTIDFAFDKALVKKIRETGIREDVTSFMVLFTAVNILLYRYVGQQDIIIGTPVTERSHIDLEDQVGFFVNNLPLKTSIEGKERFTALLNKVKKTITNANKHKEYPLELLVEELNLVRDTSRSALFDIVAIYQNTSSKGEVLSMEGIEVEDYNHEADISKFDLTFDFYESEEDILLKLVFNNSLYSSQYVEQMAEHLLQVIASCMDNPALPIDEIPVYSTEELKKLVLDFNNYTAPVTIGQTFQELFERRVQNNPAAIALLFANRWYTYAELNIQANRLAHFLRSRFSVKPDTIVAVLMNHSEKLVMAIMGILKSGAAFLPLDPAYPAERIRYMVTDVNAVALLTDNDLAIATTEPVIPVIPVDTVWGKAANDNIENPPLVNSPGDLAYVIFTSGSTGKPKGVAVENGNLVNYITWANRYYFNDRPGNCFGLFTSIGFDLTITAIFTTLLRADTIYVYNNGPVTEILEHIFDAGTAVNTIKLTPAHLSLLNELPLSTSNVQTVILGGEALKRELLLPLWKLNPGVRIFDEYGPTETTVGCIVKEITNTHEPLTIGKPITNARIYILNDSLQLQPVNAVGEIGIGGKGVSRGYLNSALLTAQKFIPDPFVPGERVYRSGDLGRRLPNGEVVFMGRKDEQVKIRGYRIEPAEIESALLAYPGIKQAAVKVTGTGEHDKLLVAYYTADREINASAVKQSLDNTLPAFLVPSCFVAIDKMPLSSNGKVDRALLPEPNTANLVTAQTATAPRTETEKKISEIWTKILGVTAGSIEDNFFTIGGHSLNALKIISEIHKQLQAKLALKDIFNHPTIRGLAERVRQSNRSAYTVIAPVEEQEFYKVSYAQRGLWIQHQYDELLNAYNISGAYILSGSLQKDLLEQAFVQLVNRHEILRTVFIEVDGEPKQRVYNADTVQFELNYTDLRKTHGQTQLVNELAAREALEPFELDKFPLLRARLLHIDEQKYVLLFTIHHIIADGWSLELIVHEIVSAYNGLKNNSVLSFQPLKNQYKDYTVWQADTLRENRVLNERYWQQQLEEELPALNLPFDFQRPAVKTFSSDAVRVPVKKDTLEEIRKFCLQNDVTLYSFLVAGVNILLYWYTGQSDIAVGMADSGRHHGDLENQVGLYLNMLVLRNELQEEKTLADVCRQVHQTVLDALEHKDYPFELLAEKFGKQRDLSRTPFFDVEVALTNFNRVITGKVAELDGVEVSLLNMDTKTGGKFDLDFIFIQEADDIDLLVFFNTDLYKRSTIIGMIENLQLVMQQVLNVPAGKLAEIGNHLQLAKKQQHDNQRNNLRNLRLDKLTRIKK